MGLDMYLKGRRFLWRHTEADSRISTDIGEELGLDDSMPVQEVTVEAGYWRKANAIHRWFVTNVQAGRDDCGCYPVSREQLDTLRQTCQRVLADRSLADELLPTGEGFFFGSTDYDDWYFQDCQATVEIIDRVLALDTDQWSLEYNSSW
jgi:hypothetical protein